MSSNTLFDMLDSNQGGRISKPEWDKGFAKLDDQKKNAISKIRWCAKGGVPELFMIAKCGQQGDLTFQEWQAAFRIFDKDEDGQLSIGELQKQMESAEVVSAHMDDFSDEKMRLELKTEVEQIIDGLQESPFVQDQVLVKLVQSEFFSYNSNGNYSIIKADEVLFHLRKLKANYPAGGREMVPDVLNNLCKMVPEKSKAYEEQMRRADEVDNETIVLLKAFEDRSAAVRKEDMAGLEHEFRKRSKLLEVLPGEKCSTPDEYAMKKQRATLKNDVEKIMMSLKGLHLFASKLADKGVMNFGAQYLPQINSELNELGDKVANSKVTIPFMGPVKAGKSTAMNALLGQCFAPSHELPMTVLPMVIEHEAGAEYPVLTIPQSLIYQQCVDEMKAICRPGSRRGKRGGEKAGPVRKGWSKDDVAAIFLEGSVEKELKKILTTPEHLLFSDLLTGKLNPCEWSEPLVLRKSAHECHERVATLNHLCRMQARFHQMLDGRIYQRVQTIPKLDDTGDNYKEVANTSLKVCGELSVFFQFTGIEALKEASKAKGGMFAAFGDTAAANQVLQEVQQQLEKVGDAMKALLPASKTAVNGQKPDLKGPKNLLQALLKAGQGEIPWPKITFDMPFMQTSPSFVVSTANADTFGGAAPSVFQLVDTPGLDEIQLLPELREVVHSCTIRSQATVCLADANKVGTDAFQGAMELVKEVRQLGVPVVVLCNFFTDKPANKRKEICFEVGKQVELLEANIMSGMTQGKGNTHVFPIAAKLAFDATRLNSWLRDGRIPDMCQVLSDELKPARQKSSSEHAPASADELVVLKNLLSIHMGQSWVEVPGNLEEFGRQLKSSDQSGPTEQEEEIASLNEEIEMAEEELQEIKENLRMDPKKKATKEEKKEAQLQKLRKALRDAETKTPIRRAGEVMPEIIEKARAQGFFEEFEKHVKFTLMPKALALEVINSLARLVNHEASLKDFLHFQTEGLNSLLQSGDEATNEKAMWETFLNSLKQMLNTGFDQEEIKAYFVRLESEVVNKTEDLRMEMETMNLTEYIKKLQVGDLEWTSNEWHLTKGVGMLETPLNQQVSAASEKLLKVQDWANWNNDQRKVCNDRAVKEVADLKCPKPNFAILLSQSTTKKERKVVAGGAASLKTTQKFEYIDRKKAYKEATWTQWLKKDIKSGFTGKVEYEIVTIQEVESHLRAKIKEQVKNWLDGIEKYEQSVLNSEMAQYKSHIKKLVEECEIEVAKVERARNEGDNFKSLCDSLIVHQVMLDTWADALSLLRRIEKDDAFRA